MDHPERKEDEFYLGNYMEDIFYNAISWQTKRFGIQPYYNLEGGVLGEKIKSSQGLKPVFIKKIEVKKASLRIYDLMQKENC
jgi:hypothetical protein